MHLTTLPRLTSAWIALMAAACHLTWEATHGGIQSHHLLQSTDFPAISNAWGLLVLPVLAAWAGGQVPRASAARRDKVRFALGLVVPLLMGAALSLCFSLHWHTATEVVFLSLMVLALLLPAHRPHSLFGFVLGMSWVFGAVLPLLVGGVIGAASWLLRTAARRAWRLARPA